MGRVHHPGIKERGIAPLQFPSYQRPSGLDPSSLAVTPFRGNGSQRPLERGHEDANLAVVDFAPVAAPLAFDPDRVRASLGETARIEGDDAIGMS
jgi:hypothetical protein